MTAAGMLWSPRSTRGRDPSEEDLVLAQAGGRWGGRRP